MTGLGGTSMTGEMKLGQFKLTSDAGVEVTLEAGTGRMNGREVADGVMLDGDMRMTFPGLSFKQEGMNVAVKDLVMSQVSNSSDGKATITQTFSTGEIQLPESEELATFKNLISKGLELEFSMGGLDVEKLKAMGGNRSRASTKAS